MPAVLFITDNEIIKRMEKEKRRRGDKTATKTATKVLLEYFALRDHGVLPDVGKPRKSETAPA